MQSQDQAWGLIVFFSTRHCFHSQTTVIVLHHPKCSKDMSCQKNVQRSCAQNIRQDHSDSWSILATIYAHTHTLLDHLEQYSVGYFEHKISLHFLAKHILGAFWMVQNSNSSLAIEKMSGSKKIQLGPRCDLVIPWVVLSAKRAERRSSKYFKTQLYAEACNIVCLTG